jgi:hypothetical protein
MSHNENNDSLLDDYEARAKVLQTSDDPQSQFLGVTGRLLARTQRALWSQEDLKKQIDERVQAKCETCQKHAKPQSLRGVIVANFRFVLVCVTIILSAWGLKSTARTVVETAGIVQGAE